MGKKIYNKYLKARKKYLILLILLIGMGVALNAMPPYVFGEILDTLSLKEKTQYKQRIFVYIFILFLVYILSTVETILGQWLVTTIENDIKNNLMERIIYLKKKNIDNYKKGELLNRLEFDVETIVNYYIDIISSILMIIINLLISIYFIVYISVKLSLIVIAFLPILYGVNYIFRNRIQTIESRQKKVNDQYYSFTNMTFDNVEAIKAFSIQDIILNGFKQNLDNKLNIEMKNTYVKSGITLLRAFISNMLNFFVLVVAGMFIMLGEMTLGNMVTFSSYMNKLFEALSKILELNLNRQGVIVSYKRIEELEQDLIELDEKGSIIVNKPISKIILKELKFSYGEKVILKHVDMCLENPGLYSIVGKNGCGKTTILKLLERFYRVDSGEILLDGINIEQYQLRTLRKEIVYMPKAPFFIMDTIYNNLRLGNNNITDELIENACTKVGIHDDIMSLEQQYKTIVMEGGKNFSSGQKQKLGIARILLCKASVYLLDEITSDLDSLAEKNICDLLENLAKECIVINISHKEECLKRSKQIFVMNQGEIVEKGTHDLLLKKSGIYKRMYDYQK